MTTNTERLEQLQKLHAADPNDADLPYMIALELGKSGDCLAAIDWLDKTIALNAHYHYAYFQKAKMQDEEGEGADALVTLDEGIKQATEAGDAKAIGELQELRTMMEG
ncbi:MAG: tetratricopeptide repeat protein [Phycisphaeraceae bacterium]